MTDALCVGPGRQGKLEEPTQVNFLWKVNSKAMEFA
jgi:hypothetical protein